MTFDSNNALVRYCNTRFLLIVLKWFLGVLSAYYFLMFTWLALFNRTTHPFELDFMEGGMLCHVKRFLDGGALYCAPTEIFTPYIYTPFFYLTSAALSFVTGNTFFTIRIISVIATYGSTALIVLLLKNRFRIPTLYAVYGGAFFIAAYNITGTWYDIGRIDPLFVFLLLLSVYTLLSENTFIHSAVSAVCFFLAFYTKQAALIIGLPLALWVLLFRRGRHRIIFPAFFIGLCIISTLYMDYMSDGWYSYYVFDAPSGHSFVKNFFRRFWIGDILKHAAIALFFSIYCLLSSLHSKDWKRFVLDCLLLGTLLGSSCLGRMHWGGALNCLIPAYAGLAVFFARGLYHALNAVPKSKQALPVLLLAAAVVQLAFFFYLPSGKIPSAQSVCEGNKLLEVIQSFEGDVLIPCHAWYTVMAGKRGFAHSMAVTDVYRAKSTRENTLRQRCHRAIADRKYAAVILDLPGGFPFNTEEFSNGYTLVSDSLTTSDFVPVASWPVHPIYLYVRKGT